MKINSVESINNNYNKADKSNNQHQSSPNFKGLLDIPGSAMSGIEKGGFIASFLIQDTLGMTVPRSGEGLIRGIDRDRVKSTWNVFKAKLTFREPSQEDKEKCLKLKELNFKEGAEVLIREGLSGPLMMFTPVAVLLLGKKFVGKSTFTNSSMIKRLGKEMTNIVKDGAHESTEELKNSFYRTTVEKMVKATTGCTDHNAEGEFINKAVESMKTLDRYEEKMANSTPCRKNKIGKLKKREQERLLQSFNEFHKNHSSDYNMLNRVKLDGQVYSTEKTINGIRDYAKDVLKNKNIEDITVEHTENVQTKSMVSRIVVNALAAASTIGSLSIVPMLYKIVNPVPPGALGDPKNADEKINANKPKETTTDNKNNGNVSFTGRYDRFARAFEFDGNQLTPALMTSLAAVGLLTPRVHTAAKRAPEDPVTKKKDYSEIPEIVTRDVISTGAVTFGVPMLSKALVSSYANSTGFVLQTKPDKSISTTKKILDMINPFSSFGPYGIKDLDQMYGNIDSKEKLQTFSEFIDNNDGHLAKILKTDKKTAAVFNEYGMNIKEMSKLDKKSSNRLIIDKLADSEFAEKLINALKPEKAGKANKLLKRARSLNSVTSFAATVFFVPAFLGMVLPRMVYGMTARRQKKLAAAREQAQSNNQLAQAQQPQQPVEKQETNNIDYSKLKTGATSQAFMRLKNGQ